MRKLRLLEVVQDHTVVVTKAVRLQGFPSHPPRKISSL